MTTGVQRADATKLQDVYLTWYCIFMNKFYNVVQAHEYISR